MDSNSFHFLKHPSVTTLIYLCILTLFLLTTCSCFFFSSTPLTLLSLLLSTFLFFSKLIHKVKPTQTYSQEKSATSDELILGSNLFTSTESSENSISDDESLIEIALPDGHHISSRKTSSEFEHELLDYLPESLAMQHGLMELLIDINEEDSLIEIDIALGAIKCPRFEFKA